MRNVLEYKFRKLHFDQLEAESSLTKGSILYFSRKREGMDLSKYLRMCIHLSKNMFAKQQEMSRKAILH